MRIIRFAKVGNLDNPLQRIVFAVKLRKFLDSLLKKEKFDVIHSMAYIANIPASYAAKKNKIKSITSVHSYFGIDWFKATNPFSAIINIIFERLILMLDVSNIIHIPSKYLYDKISFVSSKRKRVIYNFIDIREDLKKSKLEENKIDLRKRYNLKENELILMSIGNLQKIKNFDGLIKSIAKLKRAYKLFIIGGGEERKNLERSILKNNLKEKVFLLGNLEKPKILNCMKQATAIINSSFSESFSYVMAEALVLDKPIISYYPVGISKDFKEMIYIDSKDINSALNRVYCNKNIKIDKQIFDKNQIIMQFEKLYGKNK